MPSKAKKNAPESFLENPNIVHALAYIPYFIGAVSMYFLGKTGKKAAMHHIKYSALLALGAILLIVLLDGFFDKVLSLGYLGISGYFAFKAFKGEKVQVEILDVIESKITEKVSK